MSDPCTRASAQYAKGDITRALSNISRCQKELESQLRKYKNQPEVLSQVNIQLARAYRFEGQIYFGEQNVGKAHRAFSSALQFVKKSGNHPDVVGLRGQIAYSLAIIALMRNQIKPAFDMLETAKQDFFDANMGDQALEVLMRLGSLNRDLGDYDKALYHYNLVQRNRKKAPSKEKQQIFNGRAKLEEARVLHLKSSPMVDKILKQAMKEFSKAKYYEGQGQVLLTQASNHETELPKYREYLLQAMELGKAHDLPGIAGIALTQLGVLSLKSGEFEHGKDQLLEGLRFRTEAGDTSGTAQTLVELARITLISARSDQDLTNAIKFADQAYQLYDRINHRVGKASTLEIQGSINTKLGNTKEAKQQIQNAKSIYSENNDINGEARMLTQMGLIYDLEARTEDAITVLDKAITLFDNSNNRQGLAEALHVRGMIMSKVDKKEAIESLQRSRDLYELIIGSNKEMQVILNSIDETITQFENDREDE